MRHTTAMRRPGGASAFDFDFPGLHDAAPVSLRPYEGSALLIVNVASACGFTPQYRELQQLWESKADKGLVLIGVPCNDFGRQEGGEEAEIAAFCDAHYGVTFPMTGKVEIVGADRHPFYDWVRQELGEGALPKWNFHKYLIGRDGALAGSFPSATSPLGPQLLCEIKRALDA